MGLFVTLSIMGLFVTLSIMGLFVTLSIMGLFVTLSTKDTQHSSSEECRVFIIMLGVIMLSVVSAV